MNPLHQIFNQIQTTQPNVSKNTVDLILNAIIDNNESFIDILDHILLHNVGTIPINVTNLISNVAIRLWENQQYSVIDILLHHLLQCVESKLCNARKHSILVISMLLTGAGENTYLDTMLGVIMEAISKRFFDNNESVRKTAIRIGLKYQNICICKSNGKQVLVRTILRDILRYDKNRKCRALILKNIATTSDTINALLERSIDIDTTIRMDFWNIILPKIPVKNLSQNTCIALLRQAYCEKDFDSITPFSNYVLTNLTVLEFADKFYCSDESYSWMLKRYIEMNDTLFTLDIVTLQHISVVYNQYKYIEETKGREELKLVDLSSLLSMIYSKFKVAMTSDDYELINSLLQLLEFYDIFDADCKRIIYTIVVKLVTTNTVFIRESVILLDKICYYDKEKVLGGLIQKTKGSETCLILCENILQHVKSLSFDFQNAIINEIVDKESPKSKKALFYYLYNPSNPFDEDIFKIYKRLNDFGGLADLVLKNRIEFEKIADIFLVNDFTSSISPIINVHEDMIIPLSKLLLGDRIPSSSKYFVQVIIVLYQTSNNEIKQFLTLFLSEYFKNHSNTVLSVFCLIISNISSGWNDFIIHVVHCMDKLSTTSEQCKTVISTTFDWIGSHSDVNNIQWIFKGLNRILYKHGKSPEIMSMCYSFILSYELETKYQNHPEFQQLVKTILK